MAAVDVKRQVGAEENEGLGVTELGPTVIGIQTIVVKNADFACDFANDMVFLHRIPSFDDFPGWVSAANVNRCISDGIGC
jgi:hypothetical protein